MAELIKAAEQAELRDSATSARRCGGVTSTAHVERRASTTRRRRRPARSTSRTSPRRTGSGSTRPTSRPTSAASCCARARPSDRLIPALRDVSFNVPRGPVLAVIGRNGAGKSTLCRVLNGVLPPETGRVIVRGRLNLLTPGLGFSAALTGRENITLGGLASGMSPERLAELADEIGEFAQLDEYLDLPMHSYSGGMRMRLASSIAVFLDPEILLIDEALTGGDAAFSEHIAEKTAQLIGQGRTIVLVTHGLSSVRHDGHRRALAAPGQGRGVRRSRRGRQQVHALLPDRVPRHRRRVRPT